MNTLPVIFVLGLCALVTSQEQLQNADDLSQSIASLLERTERSPANSRLLHRVKRMLTTKLDEPPLTRVKRNRRSTGGETTLVRVKRVEDDIGGEPALDRVKRGKRSLRDVSLHWLNKKRQAEGEEMKSSKHSLRERRKVNLKRRKNPKRGMRKREAGEKALLRNKRMPKDMQMTLKKLVKRMIKGDPAEFKKGLKRLKRLHKNHQKRSEAKAEEQSIEK